MISGKCRLAGRSVFGLAAWVGLSVLLMGMASCPKSINYSANPKWSVNLIQPGRSWPRLANMSPAKLEAYDQFGKPEFFRVWYNSAGELANTRQAGPLIREKDLGKLPWSWVYEKQEIEIRFESPTKFEKVPIPDKVKVLCLRGDPHEQPKMFTLKSGSLREDWIYYDVGKKYIFVDDKLGKVEVLTHRLGPAMRGL